MADHPRIEELRRRVQRDKASIAFAQLAEEYRRAGRFAEAIDTCRTGLAHHPGYLSAHVTLGRALVATGELELAQDELARVHSAAPENLAAIKGLAEIRHRLGDRPAALALYTRALQLVPQDSELEHLIGELQSEPADDSPEPVEASDSAAAPSLPPADQRETPQTVEADILPPSPDPEPETTLAADAPPPDLETSSQVDALERWLDAILADRADRR